MWISTVLLLPIFGWGISLQRTVDLQGRDITQLQRDNAGLSARVTVTENAVNGLGSLNTKIDGLTETVKGLKDNLDYIFRRELEKKP